MNSIITLNRLAELIARISGKKIYETEVFLKAFMDTAKGVISIGEPLTIKGIGTFTVEEVRGEKKLFFHPDEELARAVNDPFSMFEPEELAPGVSMETLDQEIIIDDIIPTPAVAPTPTVETEEETSEPVDNHAVVEMIQETPAPTEEEAPAVIDTEEKEEIQETTTEGEESKSEEEESESEEDESESEEEETKSDIKEPKPDEEESKPDEPCRDARTVRPTPQATTETPIDRQPSNDGASKTTESAFAVGQELNVQDDSVEEVEVADNKPTHSKSEARPNLASAYNSASPNAEYEEEEEEYEDEYEDGHSKFPVFWTAWALALGLLIGLAIGFFLHDPIIDVLEPPQTEQVDEETEVEDIAQSLADALSSEETKTIDEEASTTTEETAVPTQPQEEDVYDQITEHTFLTHLAQKHYHQKEYWVYIYLENKDKIGNPNNIKVGTRLRIPPLKKYATKPTDAENLKEAKRLAAEILK